jgi:hypothetical protein
LRKGRKVRVAAREGPRTRGGTQTATVSNRTNREFEKSCSGQEAMGAGKVQSVVDAVVHPCHKAGRRQGESGRPPQP